MWPSEERADPRGSMSDLGGLVWRNNAYAYGVLFFLVGSFEAKLGDRLRV